MDKFYRDILNPNGIYAAIDTYDMAKVVRAAMSALHPTQRILPEAKSKMESEVSRNIGNEHYKAGTIRLAIAYYNRAIAFAPKSSQEMILAYGNRSAVFFSIRYFTACLKDIDTCLSMGCSEVLAKKLKKRRDDATPFMFEEFAVQMVTHSEFITSYLRFDCERNADVPSASSDVVFSTQDGAKRASARAEIRAGSVVAVERAFVSCPVNTICYWISCSYCNRAELCLYPCEGCCRALFCGNECRLRCLKEYHHIECQIARYLSYDEAMLVLITRAAIKMSLKMGWDEFITASKDIGASRMRTATVKQTFSSEEPVSILSYNDDRHFMEGRMYNGSIICALTLHHLCNIEQYFPKGTVKRESAVDAMARVMLHLYVTFTNKILILSSAYDFKSNSFSNCMLVHHGWFTMSSKLKHSCEPNLLVVGLNDSVALVALRTIRRGEELTISFCEHPNDKSFTSVSDRMIELFMKTRIMCECWLCMKNWNRNNAVNVEMNKKQAKLIAKLDSNAMKMDYVCFNTICEALDTFPITSVQYAHAYDAMQWMLNVVQSKYYNNVTHT